MAAKKSKKKKPPAKKKAATKKAAKTQPPIRVQGGTPPVAVGFGAPEVPSAVEYDDAVNRLRAEKVAAIAGGFNADGRKVLVPASQAPNTYLLRRPTGIFSLDLELGGGPPAGGLCTFSGPDNSGKTWLLLRTMAMQQAIYGDSSFLLFVPTEGGFPHEQAMRAGLVIPVPDDMLHQWNEMNRQRGHGTFTPEQIAHAKRAVGRVDTLREATGETLLEKLLTLIGSGVYNIAGVDSVQGLQPQANADKELEENDKMSAHAMLMQRFLYKYACLTTGLTGVNYTTLIMTQQVRANKGKAEAPVFMQKYLPDYVVTGASALKHFKLIDLLLETRSPEKKELPGVGKVVVAKEVKWTTIKGKCGTHDNKTGAFKFSYGLRENVDAAQNIVDTALTRGALRTTGRGYEVCMYRLGPAGELQPIEYLSAPSLKGFKERIACEPSFKGWVEMELLGQAGVNCIYRLPSDQEHRNWAA